MRGSVAEEELPEAIQPVSEGSQVPALHEDKEDAGSGTKAKMGGALAASAFFAIVSLGFILAKPTLVRSMPQAAPIYEAIGIEAPLPGYGIVFDKLHAEGAGVQGGVEVVHISGTLINLTSDTQGVPMISAAFLDEDDTTLSHFYIHPPVDHLDTEGQESFTAQAQNPHPQARKILFSLVLSMEGQEGSYSNAHEPEHQPAPSEDAHHEEDVHHEEKPTHGDSHH